MFAGTMTLPTGTRTSEMSLCLVLSNNVHSVACCAMDVEAISPLVVIGQLIALSDIQSRQSHEKILQLVDLSHS
jgi:hypothetical protein